jgi:hypothetical protein
LLVGLQLSRLVAPAALTGRIDVRFADTTLIDLAAGGTPVDLEFA